MSIRTIKGIGEKTEKLFNRVNVYTVTDLMHFYPRTYEVFKKPLLIKDINDNSLIAVSGVIVMYPDVRRYANKTLITSVLEDSNGDRISLVWFNMPFIRNQVKVGERYVLRGRVTIRNKRLSLEQPLIYTEKEYELKLKNIQPIYPLTKGLSNNTVIKSVKESLLLKENYRLNLNDEIAGKYDLEEFSSAINNIHFPSNFEELSRARDRLVFEEFYCFLTNIKKLKDKRKELRNDFIINRQEKVDSLIENLPYKLTKAQKRVFEEIRRDLNSNSVCSRMIQGDVGSGKTILAFLASIETVINGYQAAIMAPTEVLAIQHYEALKSLLAENDLDIKTELLTGSTKNKKAIYEKLENKEIEIIVGTHALIQENVKFSDLALVITDEQHRFGVRQRQALENKGNDPHIIVMSATPIPRTLALILYGDLDLSVLDEMPEDRKAIKNCLIEGNDRRKALDFIKKEIEKGHQAYIVCSMIEESENSEAENVKDYVKSIRKIFPKEISIEALHGEIKAREKNEIMERFSENKIQILVATTVIEVGINVTNATVIMIENSERFGLASLHQLRGRVGRGSKQSYCIFVTATKNEKTLKKLDLISKSNDGFLIAEEDLKNRGPGDLLGVRQSGEMLFALGDIYSDYKLLEWARREAELVN